MSALDVLLRTEIPQPQCKEFKLKRFSELAGEDVIFKLKELTYSRVAEIQKMSDDSETEIQIILAGTVEPDLKNKELLEKYGAITPAELLKKMLSPGEIADICRAVERLSGFRSRTIEEVKKK